MKHAARSPAASQRGVSLVELMVAGTLGLIVIAAGLRLVASQLDGTRRLMDEARLHQDLRAAVGLVARDVRRAGYWQRAVPALRLPAPANPYAAATPAAGPATTQARYAYSRDATENDAVDLDEAFGFRLEGEVLQVLEGGRWQQLSDPGTLVVTRLSITPHTSEQPLGAWCDPPCDATDPACPRLVQRRLDIELAGRSSRDASVRREIRDTIRLRNDAWPVAQCPAGAAP